MTNSCCDCFSWWFVNPVTKHLIVNVWDLLLVNFFSLVFLMWMKCLHVVLCGRNAEACEGRVLFEGMVLPLTGRQSRWDCLHDEVIALKFS